MKRAPGFTLIELLIVVLIGAILVVMAFPSYAAYVTKARRVEAQSHMLALLQLQERHFGATYRYLAFSADQPAPADTGMRWWTGPAPVYSAYEYAALPCQGYTLQQCVRIRALPGTARVNKSFVDQQCGVLEASSLGERSAAHADKGCWP